MLFRSPAPAQLRLLEGNAPTRSEVPLRLAITVPVGAARLTIDVWDRFGEHVRHLLDEPQPAAGPRIAAWDATDDGGQPLAEGSFIIRVTVDDHSESQIVYITGRGMTR